MENTRETALATLKNWFAFGQAGALIKAYTDPELKGNFKGTYGTRTDLKAAVFDDRGVLTPEAFSNYMIELQGLVIDAQRGHDEMTHVQQTSLRYLQSTLQQMYDSVDFGAHKSDVNAERVPTGQLFENAKKMADVMEKAFPVLELGNGRPR